MTRVNSRGRELRRGSALLVVLGFLAFMIVSAVAYSIYMRAERLPSSALRRTVQTRHLVKAALAHAISDIDDAMRDDPFPGLTTSKKYLSEGGAEQGEKNHWIGRVFMPPSLTGTDKQLYVAPSSKTVSTLTLEGLGYLPPALVNDVRFLSRSSWSGQWNTLPFDSGRAAYCAVNVTDMLDITRLYANLPRSSIEGGRISLAYLFDPNFNPADESGCSVDGFSSGPENFDKLVHDDREAGNGRNPIGKSAPFVSMLDYQLGIHNGVDSQLQSLFYRWINDGSTEQPYYEEDGQAAIWARRQPFVTESCGTNQVYKVDIATVAGQPFKDSSMKNDSASLMQVAGASTDFLKRLMDKTSDLNFADGTSAGFILDAVLFDYLDHNSVPISLAMPCVERVPMLAAIAPMGMKLKPCKAIASDPEKSGDTTTTKWKLNLLSWFNAGGFSVVVAFPFKHNCDARGTENYTVQVLARMAVVASSCEDSLRNGELYEMLRPKDKNDWKNSEEACTLKGTKGVFCVTFKNETVVENKKNIVNDDDAGTQVELMFQPPSGLANEMDFLERKQTEGKKGSPSVTTYKVHMAPLGTDGKPVVTPETDIPSDDYSKLVGESYTPILYVWARIVDGDGQTVDLAPAVLEDDQDYNGINNKTPALANYLGARQDGPLLRFKTSAKFTWQNLTDGGGGADGADKEWEPKALATLDPRYNWAPEDWYECKDSAEVAKKFTSWLDTVNDYLAKNAHGDEDLDSDIFMFTSDQGFLQSLGEFAFLPRVTDDKGSIMLPTIGDGGFDGKPRTKENIASKNCAWRSYRVDREFYEAMESRGIGRTTKYECLVNPYTPDLSVMLAALANPPSDYWSAGACATSENERKGRELKSKYGNTDVANVKDASAGLKYAFCSKNEDAKITSQEFVKLANAMKSKFRSSVSDALSDKGYDDNLQSPVAADAWKAIFDDYEHGNNDRENYQLQWWARANDDSSFNRLFGVSLSQPLYGIDRKFLYSYWRDCFANQQQLFLIFVRAESNALGGAGEGTPGQKGGRAVAMVWRNPCPTDALGKSHDENKTYQEARKPHQTRILFYHQFD